MRRLTGVAVALAALSIGTVTALPAQGAGTASISGVASSAGGGIPGVEVDVIGTRTVAGPTGPVAGPVIVASTTTGSDGSYTVSGLAPSGPDGYDVCFNEIITVHGVLDSQCWQDAEGYAPFPDPLGFVQPAAGSTPVVLADGASAQHIDSDQQLDPDVTAIVGGVNIGGNDPVRGIAIDVFNADGSPAATFPPDPTTDANGMFAFEVARSDAGHYVCFDTSPSSGGTSATGYVSVCDGDTTPWAPGLPPAGHLAGPNSAPSDNLRVPLPIGGAVSGTATEALVGARIRNVLVGAFDAQGRRLGHAVTDTKGNYRINGLAPDSGYHVCFAAAGGKGGITLRGYRDQCYKNVRWTAGAPVPATATPVTITAGVVRTGINASLSPK